MKTYIIEYQSLSNIFKGKIVTKAETLASAQDNFFDWLKKQGVYEHLWNLSFSIEEVTTYEG